MPDSATATIPGGMRDARAQARSWSTPNVRRSRWLTPTRRDPAASARSSSACVVHLHECGQAQLLGHRGAGAQLSVVEGGDDQQDGVRAHETCVGHVRRAAP